MNQFELLKIRKRVRCSTTTVNCCCGLVKTQFFFLDSLLFHKRHYNRFFLTCLTTHSARLIQLNDYSATKTNKTQPTPIESTIHKPELVPPPTCPYNTPNTSYIYHLQRRLVADEATQTPRTGRPNWPVAGSRVACAVSPRCIGASPGRPCVAPSRVARTWKCPQRWCTPAPMWCTTAARGRPNKTKRGRKAWWKRSNTHTHTGLWLMQQHQLGLF